MSLKQGHFGSIPEGLYPAQPDYSTLLVQYATSPPKESLQPQIVRDTLELLASQGAIDPTRVSSILDCDPKRLFSLVCEGCGVHAGIRAPGCNNRLCIFCNKKKRNKLFNRLEEVFRGRTNLRFLTLGFKGVTTPEFIRQETYTRKQIGVVIEGVRNAYFHECQDEWEAFRRILEKQGYRIGTYANVLEIVFHKAGTPRMDKKKGSERGVYEEDEWNVHYHIVYDGDFIPNYQHNPVLSNAFKKATKGKSFYTYVERVKDRDPIKNIRKAISYTIKYLGKVTGHDGDPQVFATFYQATQNVRFYNVGWKKEERHKKEKLKLTCTYCDSQSWITPYNAPREWASLIGNQPPDENAVCLKPPHPTPVVTIHEEENVSVTYEDIEDTRPKKYSRNVLLDFLVVPQHLSAICAQFDLERFEALVELETLAERGDVMELRPDLWVRVA